MNLNEVNDKAEGKEGGHRLGRGPGSGWGKTSGRGHNGAGSRSGFKRRMTMDGGQMPFVRRIAKRGFTNADFRREWSFVNLRDLSIFEEGETVTPELCLERGVIPKMRAGLKLLGVGELNKKLTIRVHRVSKSAKAAVEAAGGSVELIPAAGDLAKQNWKDKRGKGKTTQRRKSAQQSAEKRG